MSEIDVCCAVFIFQLCLLLLFAYIVWIRLRNAETVEMWVFSGRKKGGGKTQILSPDVLSYLS